MRQNRRTVARNAFWLVSILCIAAVVAFLSRPAMTAEYTRGQTQIRQTRPSGNPLIKIGEFPPDFELPRLTFKTDDAGKPIGIINEKDTIRLSSFRGKRPVCLIMSSYT